MRFNNPPGWPIPPTGWRPPPGWQPDPSWPPAPEGWPLWIPEQERPRSHRRAWILAGLGAALAIALVGALLIYPTGGSSRNVGASDKPDIDNLNESMIVTAPPTSEFEGSWSLQTIDSLDDSFEYEPEVCDPLAAGFYERTTVSGEFSDNSVINGMVFRVELHQTEERPNLTDAIAACSHYTGTYTDRAGDEECCYPGEIKPVDVSGLPDWASAALHRWGPLNGELSPVQELFIVGFYRGIFVQVSAFPADFAADQAVALFNDQIARLESV